MSTIVTNVRNIQFGTFIVVQETNPIYMCYKFTTRSKWKL